MKTMMKIDGVLKEIKRLEKEKDGVRNLLVVQNPTASTLSAPEPRTKRNVFLSLAGGFFLMVF